VTLCVVATLPSASLLFTVEPMVAKMLLPLLGGSPAVWNTCMVFYPSVLLAGHGHAHLISRRLGPRAQARTPGAVGSEPAPLFSRRSRLLFVLLALVPSSALLGARQYVTTDIAAIPLLWVIPLSRCSPRWSRRAS
jgi:hypothetical protein